MLIVTKNKVIVDKLLFIVVFLILYTILGCSPHLPKVSLCKLILIFHILNKLDPKEHSHE